MVPVLTAALVRLAILSLLYFIKTHEDEGKVDFSATQVWF